MTVNSPTPLVAGIDVGSTNIKALVCDADGEEITVQQVRTPWRTGPNGATELDADALMERIRELLDLTAEALGDRSIDAIGIAGMGETGIVIDSHGTPVAPGFAWFDPRGQETLEHFPDSIREQFSGRTGLPFGVQVSSTKLALLRDSGIDLQNTQWLNVPEFVAYALGGDAASEISLASRTGLLDQDAGGPWVDMLDHLGATSRFLPPLRAAGHSWGRVSADAGPAFSGAHLTVAGHDHLVAAQASGLASGTYFVSLGTAEVLLRVIDGPLGFDARQRLADALINEAAYIEPGKHVLVAGVKTGLLLRRALEAFGVSDAAGRNHIDDAVMALPVEGNLPPGSIEVSGARNDDGMLALRILADNASPAEIFAAILRHSNDEICALLQAMDRELPPATRSTITGGWTSMRSIVRSREQVLPDLSVSTRAQDTAFGAALCAQRLMTTSSPGTPANPHSKETSYAHSHAA